MTGIIHLQNLNLIHQAAFEMLSKELKKVEFNIFMLLVGA